MLDSPPLLSTLLVLFVAVFVAVVVLPLPSVGALSEVVPLSAALERTDPLAVSTGSGSTSVAAAAAAAGDDDDDDVDDADADDAEEDDGAEDAVESEGEGADGEDDDGDEGSPATEEEEDGNDAAPAAALDFSNFHPGKPASTADFFPRPMLREVKVTSAGSFRPRRTRDDTSSFGIVCWQMR